MSVLTTPQAVAFINGPKAEGERYPVGPETFTRWAAEGRVRGVRTKRGWLFDDTYLAAWLANGMQNP